ERAHRHLLRLGCLFASVERAPDRPREQGIFEQLRQRAPEPLLGRAAEAIAQALGDAAPVRHARALLHRSLSDARSAHAVGRTAKEGYGAAMAERLFLFVQFEFPWELGPPDGRFVLRAAGAEEPERVVVLGTLGSSPRPGGVPRRRSRRRGTPVPPTPQPSPVSVARATIVDPVSLSAERQAEAWLAGLD